MSDDEYTEDEESLFETVKELVVGCEDFIKRKVSELQNDCRKEIQCYR